MGFSKIWITGNEGHVVTVPKKVIDQFQWEKDTQIYIDWYQILKDTIEITSHSHMPEPTENGQEGEKNGKNRNESRTKEDNKSRGSISKDLGESRERRITTTSEREHNEELQRRRRLEGNKQFQTERPTETNDSSETSIRRTSTEDRKHRIRRG
jgi:hypothetical protein